jgi:AraC-like DNA-binding protein
MRRIFLIATWVIPLSLALAIGSTLLRAERELYPNGPAPYGYSDGEHGGNSKTTLSRRDGALVVAMHLKAGHPTPFAGFGFGLTDSTHPHGIDLTGYDQVQLEMRSPNMRNIGFQLITWVPGLPSRSVDLPGMYHDAALPVTSGFTKASLPLHAFVPSSWWPQVAGIEANAASIRMDLARNFELRIPTGAQPTLHDTLEIRSIRLVGTHWVPMLLLSCLALGMSAGITFLRRKPRIAPAVAETPAPAESDADPETAGTEAPSLGLPEIVASQVSLPNRSDLELQALLAWIGQNYHRESILVEEAARGCGLSARKIPPLLKEYCGKNFPAFVASLRIAEACRLLRETDRQVSEIGLAVGFSNTGHFHRVFKAETGESPASWRERQAQGGSPPRLD